MRVHPQLHNAVLLSLALSMSGCIGTAGQAGGDTPTLDSLVADYPAETVAGASAEGARLVKSSRNVQRRARNHRTDSAPNGPFLYILPVHEDSKPYLYPIDYQVTISSPRSECQGTTRGMTRGTGRIYVPLHLGCTPDVLEADIYLTASPLCTLPFTALATTVFPSSETKRHPFTAMLNSYTCRGRVRKPKRPRLQAPSQPNVQRLAGHQGSD